MAKESVELSQSMIEAALRELGLAAGDLVFFHSSLMALGSPRKLVQFPNAGADLVIDAFLSVVGPTGTVAVPTLSATFAESEGGGDGPTGHVFDPAETPSRVGSITNVFRRRPQAVRSGHPTHSVAAIGARAAEYTAGHELVNTFDWLSPYGRTVRWDGYICYFGTSTNTNTHIHAVEEWMELPYLQDDFALVRGADGQTLKVRVRRAPPGPRDFYGKNGSMVHELLARSGIWRQTTVGRATVTLMKARDCFDVVFRGLIAKPDLLLNRKDDPWTARWRQRTIDYVRERWGDVIQSGCVVGERVSE